MTAAGLFWSPSCPSLVFACSDEGWHLLRRDGFVDGPPGDAIRLEPVDDTTPDDLRQVQALAFADGRLAERTSPSPGPLDRIQSDPDGTVDEAVWTGTAHFEMSDDTSGYLHLTRGDTAVFLRVQADGGRLVVREEWRDGDIGDEENNRG